MTPDLATSLTLAIPELSLAVAAMVLLMVGVFSGARANMTVSGLAVAVFLGVGAWILLFPDNGSAFGGAFIDDPFARFMKMLTLIGSLVTLVMSVGFARAEKFDRFEYPVLIMLATLGMMLMVSANNMITLYLGLELQSLAAYVLAAINRDNLRSTEAGLKYFVLGALSSGMLLYGISLVYGYTGNTGFPAIAAALGHGERAARPRLRPGLRAGGAGLQDLGRALPHVDARRLRGLADAGHRLLRRRAQDGGDGADRARHRRRVRAGGP